MPEDVTEDEVVDLVLEAIAAAKTNAANDRAKKGSAEDRRAKYKTAEDKVPDLIKVGLATFRSKLTGRNKAAPFIDMPSDVQFEGATTRHFVTLRFGDPVAFSLRWVARPHEDGNGSDVVFLVSKEDGNNWEEYDTEDALILTSDILDRKVKAFLARRLRPRG